MNKEKNDRQTGGVTRIEDIPRVIEALREIYDELVTNLRNALARYLKTGERPDPRARAEGLFAYPELRLDYRYGAASQRSPPRAFGRLNQPGRYATSIARPHLFREYLIEQLDLLISDYEVEVEVGRSPGDPVPLCAGRRGRPRLDGARRRTVAAGSRPPNWPTSATRSPTAPGTQAGGRPRPLALFDGLRTDFRWPGCAHYTGTPAEHIQQYHAVHQLHPLRRRVRPLGAATS